MEISSLVVERLDRHLSLGVFDCSKSDSISLEPLEDAVGQS